MDPNLPTPTPPDSQTPPALSEREQTLTGELETVRQELADSKAALKTALEQKEPTVDANAEQRIKDLEAENGTLKTERHSAKSEAADLKTRSALAGKVRDPEAAARLLSPDLLDKDGAPDTTKLLEKYPFLAPDTTPVIPAATAPDGGGATQKGASGTASLEDALKTKDTAAINAAFDAEVKAGGITK